MPEYFSKPEKLIAWSEKQVQSMKGEVRKKVRKRAADESKKRSDAEKERQDKES